MFLVMFRRFLIPILLVLGVSALAKTKFQPLPVHLDHDGEKWAQKTLRKMSVEEKVGQLFMIWTRAEFLYGSRRELQSRQSHYQHAFFWRGFSAGWRFCKRIYPRSTFGGTADHCKAFSRPRGHRNRFPSRPSAGHGRSRAAGLGRAAA